MINPFQMHTAFAKHTKAELMRVQIPRWKWKEQPAKMTKILADVPQCCCWCRYCRWQWIERRKKNAQKTRKWHEPTREIKKKNWNMKPLCVWMHTWKCIFQLTFCKIRRPAFTIWLSPFYISSCSLDFLAIFFPRWSVCYGDVSFVISALEKFGHFLLASFCALMLAHPFSSLNPFQTPSDGVYVCACCSTLYWMHWQHS